MPIWVKALAGVITIAAVLGGLWAIFKPAVRVLPPSRAATPESPRLHDAHATVVVRHRGSARRATIACDGDRRTATGFWTGDPLGACDALASTRAALLAGPGCARVAPQETTLHIAGAFGQRAFDRQIPFGGCRGDDWLAVNVLASPVLGPQREAEDAGTSDSGP